MGFKINVPTRTDTMEGLESKRYLIEVTGAKPWLNDTQEEIGFIVNLVARDVKDPEMVEGESYDRFPVGPKMLWKIRGFMYALGIRHKKAYEIDSDELIGKKCLGDLTWYDPGQNKNKLPNWKYYPIDEEASQTSSEETPSETDDDTPF